MLNHLPTYQSPDLRIVRAGRIKEIVGGQMRVSTAPVGLPASQSTGYPLIAVTIDEWFKAVMRPTAGKVLVASSEFDVGLSDEMAFVAAYKLVKAEPPLTERR